MKRGFFAAALLCACGGHPPAIESFTASPSSVQAGGQVSLSWVVHGASKIVLDPGGAVQTGNSTTATPAQTTTYTLTASNSHGSKSATATVSVVPVLVVTSVPAQIRAGEHATLKWAGADAATVSIASEDGPLGDFPAAQGSLDVQPARSLTYTVSANGHRSSVRVRVVAVPAISGFAPDKASVAAGEAVTLTWSSTGVSHVVDHGVGFIGSATSAVVRPSQTTTYQLTSFGPTGLSASATTTVTVAGPPPAVSLSYVDPVVPAGAILALLSDPSSTPQALVLRVVAARDVPAAGALAIDFAIDATRVALQSFAAGSAIDPGPAPLAARVAMGAGPLTNRLVIGIARKAASPGVVPDVAIAAGAELCRFTLVPAAGAQPGTAIPAGTTAQGFLGHLPRDPAAAPAVMALGELTL